jgi:hypothetical protein
MGGAQDSESDCARVLALPPTLLPFLYDVSVERVRPYMRRHGSRGLPREARGGAVILIAVTVCRDILRGHGMP